MHRLNKKKPGQTILVVVVISTLALLILLSMADRVLLARVNLQKTAEFDRSIAAAENRVNEVIRLLYNQQDPNAKACLNLLNNAGSEFVELDCPLFNSNTSNLPVNAKVYGRVSSNNFVTVTSQYPLLLKLGESLSRGVPTTSVSIQCDRSINVLVTRAYIDTTTNTVKVDKGIVNGCSNLSTNVTFFSRSNTGEINPVPNTTVRENTLYIRARNLSYTSPEAKIALRVLNNNNLVASTQKYEFVVTGMGGLDAENNLGSDSIITFEKGAGKSSVGVPLLQDYAYFETTAP